MAHQLSLTTRQAVLVMEALNVQLEGMTWDYPDKLAEHDVHQQVSHSLAYQGRLTEDSPEIEPPTR